MELRLCWGLERILGCNAFPIFQEPWLSLALKTKYFIQQSRLIRFPKPDEPTLGATRVQNKNTPHTLNSYSSFLKLLSETQKRDNNHESTKIVLRKGMSIMN
jgi:hypothetical protein